jgi:hypothetical protein
MQAGPRKYSMGVNLLFEVKSSLAHSTWCFERSQVSIWLGLSGANREVNGPSHDKVDNGRVGLNGWNRINRVKKI